MSKADNKTIHAVEVSALFNALGLKNEHGRPLEWFADAPHGQEADVVCARMPGPKTLNMTRGFLRALGILDDDGQVGMATVPGTHEKTGYAPGFTAMHINPRHVDYDALKEAVKLKL